jgi:hypothetical protein
MPDAVDVESTEIEGYVLDDQELGEQVSAELETAVPRVHGNSRDLPAWAIDGKVTVCGQEFTIGEPDVGVTLRILNVFGQLAVRGERVAVRALKSLAAGSKETLQVSNRAAMFGMLAAMNKEDLIALGSAVLQFGDDRKGREFLRSGKGLALSPIIRALFLNVANSQDLKESLTDFFDGLGMMEVFLEGLNLSAG